MKTKLKIFSKNQKSILENRNFLNSQNYIISKDKKNIIINYYLFIKSILISTNKYIGFLYITIILYMFFVILSIILNIFNSLLLILFGLTLFISIFFLKKNLFL